MTEIQKIHEEIMMTAFEKANEVKAIAMATHMSVDELIRQAKPPKWKFWISEKKRAAAVQLLLDRGKNDSRAFACLCEVAKKDSSPNVRRLATKYLPALADNQNQRDTAVATLVDLLIPSQDMDVAIQAIRAIGLIGESIHGAEKAISSYVQARQKDPKGVSPRVLLWMNFVSAKLSADSSDALAAIRKVIEENVYTDAFKAAKTAPKAGSLPMEKMGQAIALAREVDYELINSKEIESIAAYSNAWTLPLAAAATYAAKRKVEALEAAARLGVRGRPLLEAIRKLLAPDTPLKLKDFAERAISEIEKT
jgi:hypothetical protein